MPRIPIHKEANEANTSDYECSNCGAVLKGVNNKEIRRTINPLCVCNKGNLMPIRNAPVIDPSAQEGHSFPGALQNLVDLVPNPPAVGPPGKELDNVAEKV
jgi:hypothetical protein